MQKDKEKEEELKRIRIEYRKSVGNKLKEARVRAGYTQKDVCRIMKERGNYDMPQAVLSNYECGNRMPPMDTFALLAKIYKTTADELLDNKSPI